MKTNRLSHVCVCVHVCMLSYLLTWSGLDAGDLAGTGGVDGADDLVPPSAAPAAPSPVHIRIE